MAVLAPDTMHCATKLRSNRSCSATVCVTGGSLLEATLEYTEATAAAGD